MWLLLVCSILNGFSSAVQAAARDRHRARILVSGCLCLELSLKHHRGNCPHWKGFPD